MIALFANGKLRNSQELASQIPSWSSLGELLSLFKGSSETWKDSTPGDADETWWVDVADKWGYHLLISEHQLLMRQVTYEAEYQPS